MNKFTIDDDMKKLILTVCDVFKDRNKEKESVIKTIVKKYYKLSSTEYKDIKKLDDVLEEFGFTTNKEIKRNAMRKYYQNNREVFKERYKERYRENVEMINKYKQIEKERNEQRNEQRTEQRENEEKE